MKLLGVRDVIKMAVHMAAILDFTKNLNLSRKPGKCKYIFFLLEMSLNFMKMYFKDKRTALNLSKLLSCNAFCTLDKIDKSFRGFNTKLYFNLKVSLLSLYFDIYSL